MKKINFSKVTHLSDWMSTEYSQLNSHVIRFGDDIYHDHSFYEIIYVLNGQIPHYINQIEMNLRAGDMLFIRPTDSHIFVRNGNNNSAHRDIIISMRFFKMICDFLDSSFYETYNNEALPYKINLPLEQIEIFEAKISKYYQISSNNISAKQLAAKFLLVDLLSYYKNFNFDVEKTSYPEWLNQLIQKMHMSQYYKDGLPTILSFFDYNQSYICHTFKKYFNITMTDYLNDLRLIYAANQLKLTNNTILFISIESGFSSISYFSKLFKKKFHCSPKIFRKTAQNISHRI